MLKTYFFLVFPFFIMYPLQLILCFKIPKGLLKMLPLGIDILAFFYAAGRYFGLIKYASDNQGNFIPIDTATIEAQIFGIWAMAGFAGIAAGWGIYFILHHILI